MVFLLYKNNFNTMIDNSNKILLKNIKLKNQNWQYTKIIRINKQYLFIYDFKPNTWRLYPIRSCQIIKVISPYLLKQFKFKKISFLVRPFLYYEHFDQYETSILSHKISSFYLINSFDQIKNIDKNFKNYSATRFFI